MLPLVMHLLAAVVRADVCRCAVAAVVVVAVLYLSPRQTATTAIAAV